MKHARADTLDLLEPLLEELRSIRGLTEKSRGVFYKKSKPFLHFHEDPAGIFADMRPGEEWLRLPVNSEQEREELVARVLG